MRGGSGRTLLASLAVAGAVLAVPGPAAGFGTIDGGGQRREHERITRAAVACPAGTGSDGDCFEPRSVAQLAGHDKKFGAVGAPDRTEVSDPAAHCDDADFLAGGGYPRTREQATAGLGACVEHLRRRFREGTGNAAGLLDDEGRIVGAAVDLGTDCVLDSAAEQRAKCRALESFGRALHGVQDFYAHSNWADAADPSRPTAADNPPGLNLPAPSPVLDLRGGGMRAVPRDLTTGCFVLADQVDGTGVCERRVTHAALNKDNGLVDPDGGAATDPTTPRGRIGDNFAKAVRGAVVETRHQWQEFQAALAGDYGPERASLMVCALTHDDPANGCRDPGPVLRGAGRDGTVRTVVALAVPGVLLGVAILLLLLRRGRRARGPDTARRSSGLIRRG
ncbi:CinY protein [Actinoplanes sp. NPDC049118]|uniref:CinY protein n=1 Tax=Actinoplanes sp. NPDC049118 TaxID=3155769 RepID=UPI0033F9D528